MMKGFIKKQKYNILFIIIGGIGGYLYWYFIGCQSGTCPITSVWYNNTIYGAVLGYLLGSLLRDSIFKKQKNKEADETDRI